MARCKSQKAPEIHQTLGVRKVAPKLLCIPLVFILIYLGFGLGFHFRWRSALAACREARTARGEFVEPAMFWTPLAFAFDVTFWPVYAWANIYHDGTPFATPCTH